MLVVEGSRNRDRPLMFPSTTLMGTAIVPLMFPSTTLMGTAIAQHHTLTLIS
ncbi:hypothetical protein [Anabaena sp. CS-542/02]|uniref:hypothetical protein n=1 Tax=Anabaena sp. CS-542/02 TaxID=3021719 RepID=UPI00232F58C3|nr:hypothetical protein [Anabaena sp. CS-542/02]MDB9445474.1 hypothetical protein [Anabaena sp. CS-542/02]